jgi:regulator of cell morphogenesis and NO signaling
MLTNDSSLLKMTLAEIVTADSRTAAVFDGLGLDYCCHGHDTLLDSCVDRAVPVSAVVDQLVALGPAPEGSDGDASADLTEIVHQIVTRHHRYVREMTPVITAWLEKLTGRHGTRHPELHQVRATFLALADEMDAHMQKEETMLFPFIEGLDGAAKQQKPAPPSPFGTLLNPIRVMESDHREAGDALSRLRALTNGYVPPDDACTTYRLCYRELAAFEADLHRHVHLENHVLFPRAIALEGTMA